MRVLVLNPGSATLKATVLDLPDLEPRFEHEIAWKADGWTPEHERAVSETVTTAQERGIPADSLGAVGYRVVHGGERFTAPVVVDDQVLAGIEALADLAPLHNPLAAATIRAGRRALPATPHVAAFDTAFHASLPEPVRRYPVPEAWVRDWGVRRYGFHGLSVAWSIRRAAELLVRPVDDLRLVVAHLGGGCSVTAVDRGRSVDTSMGMTPLEGLMMGTRAGSIDPGILLRLVRGGVPVDDVTADLEHRSGLLAVSGRTADMRELLAAAQDGDERAALAIEMFVGRAAAGIAAAATHLPVVDGVVFTGGIGEHAVPVRDRIVDRLSLLGVAPADIEPPAPDGVLSSGPAALLTIRAREDVTVAEGAARAVAAGTP